MFEFLQTNSELRRYIIWDGAYGSTRETNYLIYLKVGKKCFEKKKNRNLFNLTEGRLLLNLDWAA